MAGCTYHKELNMGDERRGGGNGAVVAIVVVLGIIMLIGVVLVVGAGMFFFAFEAQSAPMVAPLPTATMSLPVEEVKALGAVDPVPDSPPAEDPPAEAPSASER
jgi:hypothetical protein